MDYDKIRKSAMTKAALPEGWGRSVVGGKEIITKPTQKAESAVLYAPEGQEIDSGPTIESLISNTPVHTDRMTDSGLASGEFRIEDLEGQWDDLKVRHTDEELDDLIFQADSAQSGGIKYNNEQDRETDIFLGTAIKYGRANR